MVVGEFIDPHYMIRFHFQMEGLQQRNSRIVVAVDEESEYQHESISHHATTIFQTKVGSHHNGDVGRGGCFGLLWLASIIAAAVTFMTTSLTDNS